MGSTYLRGIALALTAALVTVLGPSAGAAGGYLDPTFSHDGKAKFGFRPYDYVADLTALANGKIVVVGSTLGYAADAQYNVAVARLWPNGALDHTFGGDGRVTTDLGNWQQWPTAVAVQDTGKIVIVGYVEAAHFTGMALLRYLPSGTLDPTFGDRGKVVTDWGFDALAAQAVAVQSNGMIVVGGYARDKDGEQTFVARFRPDGTLDRTFGDTGVVIQQVPSNRVGGIAIRPNDAIVVGASSYDRAVVTRYRADGTVDPTFGKDGVVTTRVGNDPAGLDFYAEGIAVQRDGTIVVGGTMALDDIHSGSWWCEMVRYRPNGTLDHVVRGYNGHAGDLAVQPDGKIVVVGDNNAQWSGGIQGGSEPSQPGPPNAFGTATKRDTPVAFVVARYMPSGKPDPSFAGDGLVTTPVGPETSEGTALVLGDGKVTVAGNTYLFGQSDVAVVRYR
jgi:uncharacterized delta-60 repeat protein